MGPSTRERLNWAELSATALETRSSGTVDGTSAWMAGIESASVMPTTAERAMMATTLSLPSQSRITSKSGQAAWMPWNRPITARRSRRSARTPPARIRSQTGAPAANESSPTRKGELLRVAARAGHGLGDLLHPAADVRQEVADPQDGEVARAQGAKAAVRERVGAGGVGGRRHEPGRWSVAERPAQRAHRPLGEPQHPLLSPRRSIPAAPLFHLLARLCRAASPRRRASHPASASTCAGSVRRAEAPGLLAGVAVDRDACGNRGRDATRDPRSGDAGRAWSTHAGRKPLSASP